MKDKYWERKLSRIIQRMLHEVEEKLSNNELDNYEIIEKLSEKYAHMINLWSVKGYGDIMTFDEFIKYVKSGGLIDYDGSGVFIDNDTATVINSVRCNVNWLNKNKPENSDFVMWYNK